MEPRGLSLLGEAGGATASYLDLDSGLAKDLHRLPLPVRCRRADRD